MRNRRYQWHTATRLGAAVTIALTLAGPSGAAAHDGHGTVRVVVGRPAPASPGVHIRAVEGGIGKLSISTSGRTTAEVLSAGGQPILRSGPRGVQANAAAPEWYTDNEPLGIAVVPPSAAAGAAARWVPVSAGRTWEWFDHRLHPAGGQVDRWSIPLRVGNRRATVSGRVEQVKRTIAMHVDAARPARGLTVAAIDRPVAALRLRNESRRPVDVLGPHGELFARIGPRGAQVNVRSPLWLGAAQYRNRDLLGARLDAAATPQLVLLSPDPQLIWPDPRLLADGVRTRWSVPVVLAGTTGRRRQAITGTTRSVVGPAGAPAPAPRQGGAPTGGSSAPSTAGGEGGGGVGILLLLGALTALVCGAALVARGRRQRAG